MIFLMLFKLYHYLNERNVCLFNLNEVIFRLLDATSQGTENDGEAE